MDRRCLITVIVWDGKTLAADKRAVQNGLQFTVTKIWKINGHLVGVSGDFPAANMLVDWYKNGSDPTKWPDCQKDKERWSTLVVITPDKKIFKYEQEPIPYQIEEEKFAFGCGGDFALAAMELGVDAKSAVGLACRFDVHCGNGVDTLTLENFDIYAATVASA